MPTRLSLFCASLIEASALAAAVLVPLFFNTTTSTVYELDKAVLIRVLACLVALAWLIQGLERPLVLRSLTAGGLRARLPPLILPTALVLLAAALASLVSIAPRVSFWGSPERAQGFYTILAYVVVFLAARHTLQTRAQVARLVTTIVVASLPVALYALAQALQLDPIRWPARVAGRPSSSIGNPIFLAEYLVMVLPLTVGALVTAWWAARRQAGLSRYLLVGGLVVSLGLQLAAIIVAQSRGPFLGLLAAAVYLGLLLVAGAGDRRWLGSLALAVLTAAGLLLLINLPGSPLAAVREIPYVGRLTQVLEPDELGTQQQRVMQWGAGFDLATSNPARLLVGYGPDTTRYAIGPFIPTDLINLDPARRTDRVHNDLLDTLATGGLISLAAYLALFLSAMRLGLTGLGLLGPRPREAWHLMAASLGGGLLAGVTAWLLAGTPALLAPAWGLGLVAGLGLYLLAGRFLGDTTGLRAAPPIRDKTQQIMVAGLLAALVGHLVALQSSFGVLVTRTLFWIYLALLVTLTAQAGPSAVPVAQASTAPQAKPAAGRRHRGRRRPPPAAEKPEPAAFLESPGEDRWARSLLLGLILGVLLADFQLTGVDLLHPTLLGLVGVTWVLGGVLILGRSGSALKLNWSALSWPVLSLGWGLLFPFLLALTRQRPVLDPTVFYLLFLAWLGLTLVGLAVALSRTGARRLPLWRSGRWLLYLGLTLVAVLAIFLTNVNVIRADINFKMAQILYDAGRLEPSIAFQRQALALAPNHDGYYSSLAQTYLSQAQVAADANQRTAALEEALQAMRRATELAPAETSHFWNLGLLYRTMAERTADSVERRVWLEQALAAFRRATALEPNRASLYVEQAQVYLALERYEEAMAASQQALARDGRSAAAYALLGDACGTLGQWEQAILAYEQAKTLKPDHFATRKKLALVYQQAGRVRDALAEAKAALPLAPAGEKEVIQALIRELESSLR